jgi:hypothetical protein
VFAVHIVRRAYTLSARALLVDMLSTHLRHTKSYTAQLLIITTAAHC